MKRAFILLAILLGESLFLLAITSRGGIAQEKFNFNEDMQPTEFKKLSLSPNSFIFSIGDEDYLRGKPLQFQGILADDAQISSRLPQIASKSAANTTLISQAAGKQKSSPNEETKVNLTGIYKLENDALVLSYRLDATPSSIWKSVGILLPTLNSKVFQKDGIRLFSQVNGRWQEITDMFESRFFGQSFAITNSITGQGLALHIDAPIAYLELQQSKDGLLFKLEHIPFGGKIFRKAEGKVIIAPFTESEGELNDFPIIFGGTTPFGVDTFLLYDADDFHSVFDETFTERLIYFNKLKQFDPDFKTTFLVVPDVFENREKLLNSALVEDLKKNGYIRFGMHGTYHAYPVDDPINPKHFDTQLADFNGPKSTDFLWLESIVQRGIEILNNQGISHSVFRAPEYKYSEQSFSVLADNGIKLVHVCDNKPLFKFSPTAIESSKGNKMTVINDEPCNRGLLTSTAVSKSYRSMTFSNSLVYLGKETSFHVHIWELWSGKNPYDGNIEYKTFDALKDFLSWLQKEDFYYRWFYGDEVATFFLDRNSVLLGDSGQQAGLNGDINIKFSISAPIAKGQNFHVILPKGSFIKSAMLNNSPLEYFNRTDILGKIILPTLPEGDYELTIALSADREEVNFLKDASHVSNENIGLEFNTVKKNIEKPATIDFPKIFKYLNSESIVLIASVITYLMFLTWGLVDYFKNRRKKL